MDKDRIYSSSEIYVGSIVRITGRNFTYMDRNNNEPWRETETIMGLNNNLFLKVDEQTYIHLRSGQKAYTFGNTWGEGDVGLDRIKPLEQKLWLGFDKNGIKHLNFTHDQLMQLEGKISRSSIQSDAEFASAFDKFYSSYTEPVEKENE